MKMASSRGKNFIRKRFLKLNILFETGSGPLKNVYT